HGEAGEAAEEEVAGGDGAVVGEVEGDVEGLGGRGRAAEVGEGEVEVDLLAPGGCGLLDVEVGVGGGGAGVVAAQGRRGRDLARVQGLEGRACLGARPAVGQAAALAAEEVEKPLPGSGRHGTPRRVGGTSAERKWLRREEAPRGAADRGAGDVARPGSSPPPT